VVMDRQEKLSKQRFSGRDTNQRNNSGF